MVAFVLNHAGVIATGLALEGRAVQGQRLVADMGMPGHHAGHVGQRQAGLDAEFNFVGKKLDLGIDQHRHRHRLGRFFVLVLVPGPVPGLVRLLGGRPGVSFGNVKDHHPLRHVDLRRRQAHTRRVGNGIHHVGDQAVDFGRLGVGHRLGDAAQHRMAHPGDLQNGHGSALSKFVSGTSALPNPDEI